MVTITNDKETKVVTKGAYNSFYKPLGFNIIEKSTKMAKEDIKVEKSEKRKEEVKEEKDVEETSGYGKLADSKRK